MIYQSKTTVVTITVTNWTEASDVDSTARFDAAHAVAVHIASRCSMDIISLSPYLASNEREECYATVIYINNGRSLDEIYAIMEPEEGARTSTFWMIVHLEEWQGTLDCQVVTRASDEQWK